MNDDAGKTSSGWMPIPGAATLSAHRNDGPALTPHRAFFSSTAHCSEARFNWVFCPQAGALRLVRKLNGSNVLTEKKNERKFMFDNYATPVLKSNRNKKPLMFGDLIAAVFEACGERRARGILTLAINARLVAFLGPQRFVISR